MEGKLPLSMTHHVEEIGTESLKQTQTLKEGETPTYCQGLDDRKEEEREKFDCATSVEQSSNKCTTRPTFSDPKSEQLMDKDNVESNTYPTNATDRKRVSRRDEHEQQKLLLHSSGQEGGLSRTTQSTNVDDGDIVVFPSQVKVCRLKSCFDPFINFMKNYKHAL